MRSTNRTLLASLGFADADRANPEHSMACRYLAGEAKMSLIEHCYKNEIEEFRKIHKIHRECAEGRIHHSQDLQDRFASIILEAANNKETLRRMGRRGEVIIHVSQNEVYTTLEIDPGDLTIQGIAEAEVAISKGIGQYKSTVGFADLVVSVKASYPIRRLEFYSDVNKSREEIGSIIKISMDRAERDHVWGKFGGSNAIGVEVKIGRVDMESVIRQIKLYNEYRKMDKWVIAAPWDVNQEEISLLQRESIKFLRLGAKFEKYKSDTSLSSSVATDSI